MLTAHSGSDGTPENSSVFLKEMLKGKISCVEIDVRKSDKDVLYLSHDKTSLVEAMLSLEEAFQILATNKRCMVNCDLKEADLEKSIIALAEKYNLVQRLIFSGTVNLENITSDEIRENVFLNVENVLPDLYSNKEFNKDEISKLIDFCKNHQIQTININYQFATNEFIRLLHQEKIAISIWTVNVFSDINRFMEMGVKNITTRLALTYKKYQKEALNIYDRI